MMAPDSLPSLLQLGFAAVMAVLIWRGYERIVGTMVKVVQDNTAALSNLEGVITELTHVTERMRTVVEALDRRVSSLEQDGERSKPR